LILKLLLKKHLLIVETLPKAVPESMFWLTDLAARTLAGFRKVLAFHEQVSGSRFIWLLAGFS
jgi:hypothetical protein